jgi:hypothetical protein
MKIRFYASMLATGLLFQPALGATKFRCLGGDRFDQFALEGAITDENSPLQIVEVIPDYEHGGLTPTIKLAPTTWIRDSNYKNDQDFRFVYSTHSAKEYLYLPISIFRDSRRRAFEARLASSPRSKGQSLLCR